MTCNLPYPSLKLAVKEATGRALAPAADSTGREGLRGYEGLPIMTGDTGRLR